MAEAEPQPEIIRETHVLQTTVLARIHAFLNEYEFENINLIDEEQNFNAKFKDSFEEILKQKSQKIGINRPIPNRAKVFPKHSKTPLRRLNLPVFKHQIEILNNILNQTFVLINGDTGCGKSTQVPQMILDYFIGNRISSQCNIICTQPRRISAIALAERVAWERNEKIGLSVGFQIRLEKRMPELKDGSILFCTTGVLLRKMETDPFLSQVTHIILDEIHERSVELDLLFGLLKIVVRYNKKLKIILMSATFSVDEFYEYFGKCPIIQISGKLYPVDVKYLEDILQIIPFEFKNAPKGRYTPNDEKQFQNIIVPYAQELHKNGKHTWEVINSIKFQTSEGVNLMFIKTLVYYIAKNEPDGAILIFLPGYDKIEDLYHILTKSPEYNRANFDIYMLHSLMPTEKQRGIFRRPDKGVRKIILSTTIAETSITIDDAVYVINPGRIKVNDFDFQNNYDILVEQWISEAHGKQRLGRAGRCQPGICYNLYTRARESTFAKHPIPEIQRVRLEPVILRLKFMCIKNIHEFLKTLVNCPDVRALDKGFQLLQRINALNSKNDITPLGYHMARLPLDPQIAKMLVLSSVFGCVEPITSIAATLSHKEPFYRSIRNGGNISLKDAKLDFANGTYSDELMYSYIMDDYNLAVIENKEWNFALENFISLSIMNQLIQFKYQLHEILNSSNFINEEFSNENSQKEHLLKSIIAAGLYPNIAYIKSVKQVKKKIVQDIVTPEDNKKVILHKWSVNHDQIEFDSKFLVYYNKRRGKNEICLYDSTMIYADSLILFGDNFKALVNDNGEYIIKISNNIEIKTNFETFEIIKILRSRFEILLRKLALNQEKSEADSNLLKALILFLSCDLD